MHKYPLLKLVSIAVAATLAPPIVAKTTYVEVFGDDTKPCTKTQPCETIQAAINKAELSPNARIIVGPGIYTETNALEIANDGTKVTSVAGASATTLTVGSGHAGVNISGNKVTFGQRKHGFTIESSSSSDAAIQLASGITKTKIEGNIVIGPVSTAFGERALNGNNLSSVTVRYNKITGWTEGISMSGTGLNGGKEKFNISDNQVQSGNDCIVVGGMGPSHATKIIGNKVECTSISIRIYSNLNTPTDKTNDKIQKNIANRSNEGVSVFGGNPNISKNIVNQGSYGIGVFDTYKASIKDNLIMNIQEYGILLVNESPEIVMDDTVVSGNTIIDMNSTSGDAIHLYQIAPKSISKNNIIGTNSCPFQLGDEIAAPINLVKNFWGSLTPMDPDGKPGLSNCDTSTLNALANENLIFKPSLKLNPVKYKGLF